MEKQDTPAALLGQAIRARPATGPPPVLNSARLMIRFRGVARIQLCSFGVAGVDFPRFRGLWLHRTRLRAVLINNSTLAASPSALAVVTLSCYLLLLSVVIVALASFYRLACPRGVVLMTEQDICGDGDEEYALS